MSDTERDAIVADYQSGEPMVRMPLAAVMEQIADRAASKAVKSYAEENKTNVDNKITAHESSCQVAKDFKELKDRLKGLAWGMFIAGGATGGGVMAIGIRIFG